MGYVSGISFPFRINAKGRVNVSNWDDLTDQKIKESIIQVLLTAKGERRMEPEFGSEIRSAIFQENDPSLENVAINFAKRALEIWEPRIEVSDIAIIRQYGKMYLRVDYKILPSQNITSFITPEVRGETNE